MLLELDYRCLNGIGSLFFAAVYKNVTRDCYIKN